MRIINNSLTKDGLQVHSWRPGAELHSQIVRSQAPSPSKLFEQAQTYHEPPRTRQSPKWLCQLSFLSLVRKKRTPDASACAQKGQMRRRTCRQGSKFRRMALSSVMALAYAARKEGPKRLLIGFVGFSRSALAKKLRWINIRPIVAKKLRCNPSAKQM